MYLHIQLLRDLLVLFEDGKRWTQHAMARDANEKFVAPGDPAAVCWCVSGGLYLVAHRERTNVNRIPERESARVAALYAIKAAVGTRTAAFPGPWNDDPATKIDHVRKAIGKAIQMASTYD